MKYLIIFCLAPILGLPLLNPPVDFQQFEGQKRVEGTVTKIESREGITSVSIAPSKSQDSQNSITLKIDSRIAGVVTPTQGTYVITWYDQKSGFGSPLGSTWLVKKDHQWTNLANSPFVVNGAYRPSLTDQDLRNLLTGKPASEQVAANSISVQSKSFDSPEIESPLADSTPSENPSDRKPAQVGDSPTNADQQSPTSSPLPILWIAIALVVVLIAGWLFKKAFKVVVLLASIPFAQDSQALPNATQNFLEFSGRISADSVRKTDQIELQIHGKTLPFAELKDVKRVIHLPVIEKTIVFLPASKRIFSKIMANNRTRIWWE